MNTPNFLNLKNFRKLLAQNGLEYKPARGDEISMTSEQVCGDPTEELAGYKANQTPATPRPQYAGLEEFERDFHWFLA
jgi:hypothetical protein